MYHLAFLLAFQGVTETTESEMGASAARAHVTVHVPPGARLYVNGLPSPCLDATETHSFRTPPIEPGRRYGYELRVEVSQEKRPVSMCRWIYFRAGEAPKVDFRELTQPSTDPLTPIERVDGTPGQRLIMPPALPDSRPPRFGLASMTEKGEIEIAYVDFKAVPHTTTARRMVDGKEKLYATTVYKWLPEEHTRRLEMKDLRAADVAGRTVEPSELRRLLRQRTIVVLAPGGKVDPFYSHTLKEGTLVLAMPETEVERVVELELPYPIPQPEEKVPPMPPAAP
jgi:uncharacterized protein (TIGR03000 family)